MFPCQPIAAVTAQWFVSSNDEILSSETLVRIPEELAWRPHSLALQAESGYDLMDIVTPHAGIESHHVIMMM